MSLNVIYFVNYFKGPFWLETNRTGNEFMRITKGVTKLKSSPMHQRLDTRSGEEATAWFGNLAAQILTMKYLSLPLIFVPVPNSDCCVNNNRISRTTRLAESVVKCIRSGVVLDTLRWVKTMRPSHQGGSRDAKYLYDNLILTKQLSVGTYVLVDDIITTGAHLRAAAARLGGAGQPCHLALCVGKTTRTTSRRAFVISEEVLPQFNVPFNVPIAGDCSNKEINRSTCDAHHIPAVPI